MTARPGYGMTPWGDGRLLAASADRERAVDVLKAGFAEGRLTKDEYDARVAQAYTARTYADLATVVADLPGGHAATPYPLQPYGPAYLPVPTRRTNSMAIASLVCGLAQPFTGGLTMIPAVILGHLARGQIRRTGEEGKGLATAGAVLGWVGISIVVLIILVVTTVAATHATPPPPSGP